MNPENLFTPLHIRFVNRNLSVETTGAHQSAIQHIRPVGGTQKNNCSVSTKAIHLYQQGVQSIFTLIVTALDKVSSAGAANGIYLINENYARGFLTCLFKQVTHTGCAYTYKQLHKIGTGDGEERHLCLTCHRFCKQCFTCSRRANQQCTAWNFTAERSIFLRIFQEVNYLHYFLLRFIQSCHIIKGDSNTLPFFNEG